MKRLPAIVLHADQLQRSLSSVGGEGGVGSRPYWNCSAHAPNVQALSPHELLLKPLSHDPSKPAAILIDIPIIAALNKKLSIDWAVTAFRMARDMMHTSEVCAATAIVNDT
jgi:hypothetical protein